MMMDHIIPKPAQITGYPLHRMVAELVDGTPALYADQGDHLLIRTAQPITPAGRSLPAPALDDVVAFTLKASVASRRGGRNLYPELHDWQARRAWLQTQGSRHGFAVLAVHVNADRERVMASGGRTFWIDASQFTGVLKITDAGQFAQALTTGIGRVGKAFGMGLLLV